MIRPAWWLLLMCAFVVLWEECGENLAIFCYRIGWETISKLRVHAPFLIPVSVRSEAACSKPSFTSFVHSTTLKESNN
jgi:hypothetical protein